MRVPKISKRDYPVGRTFNDAVERLEYAKFGASP
jgi:hypothetical protein